MLTSDDLISIKGIVDESIKPVKKDIRKIIRSQKVIVHYFDKELINI